MNAAQTEEEKAIFTEKCFNCTESPIKEWLAEFLNEDVSIAFTDYTDSVDEFGFQDDETKKHYNVFVVTGNPEMSSNVDLELLKRNEKARAACTMLFNAVHQVFVAVASTVTEEFSDKLMAIRPEFDPEHMAFYLRRINMSASRLHAMMAQKRQLDAYLATNDISKLTDEQMTHVNKAQAGIDKVLAECTKEVLDAEQSLCDTMNPQLKKLSWLYLVTEESSSNPEDLEASLGRLPTFGLTFQDPNEETYIDKLKKEYAVNE